jgi:hypothetical protein
MDEKSIQSADAGTNPVGSPFPRSTVSMLPILALFVAQRHRCCPFSLSSSLNGIRCCPFSPSFSLFDLLSRERALSVCLESECGSKFLASSSCSFEDLFLLRRLW